MNTGNTRPPRAAAAPRAGLSANRRLSRNQMGRGMLIVMNGDRSDLCRRKAVWEILHLVSSIPQIYSSLEPNLSQKCRQADTEMILSAGSPASPALLSRISASIG